MRIVYLDEAGIGKIEVEPYTTVSGVMIDADGQWRAIEDHLVGLANDLVPADKRDGFVFHATELFSGGSTFPRDAFDREARWKMLDRLLSIPVQFDLPIAMGFSERKAFMGGLDAFGITDLNIANIAASFIMCVMQVERVMREIFPDEVAMIVMENNDVSRELVRGTQRFLQSPASVPLLSEEDKKFLPLTRIIHTPHFVEKNEASILQVADACAFVIKRHLMTTAESRRFYEPLVPNLMATPKRDGAASSQERPA